MEQIGVVIVTYNRLDKLKHALDLFARQTMLPAYVLVVDNASTDGTRDYLKIWQEDESLFPRYVITSATNTGGSGGFYMGLEAAQKLEAQWIWLSDDDAFPEENALEETEKFLDEKKACLDKISAVCGCVINEGQYDLPHRRRVEYEKRSFRLDTISYVGIIIHKPFLDRVGLTEKDFFIWFDDTEHSLRLGRAGEMYCIPSVKVHHNTPPVNDELSWKSYYGTRNKLYFIRRHFPLYCFVYAAASCSYHSVLDVLHGGERRERGIMFLRAVRDAIRSRLGIHTVYKPGWKPQN